MWLMLLAGVGSGFVLDFVCLFHGFVLNVCFEIW